MAELEEDLNFDGETTIEGGVKVNRFPLLDSEIIESNKPVIRIQDGPFGHVDGLD